MEGPRSGWRVDPGSGRMEERAREVEEGLWRGRVMAKRAHALAARLRSPSPTPGMPPHDISLPARIILTLVVTPHIARAGTPPHHAAHDLHLSPPFSSSFVVSRPSGTTFQYRLVGDPGGAKVRV